VIDEIHSLLAGTYREQRILLNSIAFLPTIFACRWSVQERTKQNKRS
jgi:hypothetical protein